jgi:putative membrane protein
MLRITLAVLHLLALAIGLPAIVARTRAFARLRHDRTWLPRVFAADNAWGLSALLWVGTGLWRAFGSTEKASAYYWHQPIFWLKMGLLGAIFVLELAPMVTLIRWRLAGRRGGPADAALTGLAPVFAAISAVQVVLTVAMVITATLLARGYFAR